MRIRKALAPAGIKNKEFSPNIPSNITVIISANSNKEAFMWFCFMIDFKRLSS